MIEIVVSTLLLMLWATVYVYTHEYFIRSDKNRLRFRYWSVVAFCNLIITILSIIYKIVPMSDIAYFKLALFAVINVNLFEIFMYNAHKSMSRRTEMIIRSIFPIIIVLNIFTGDFATLALTYGLLMFVACVSQERYFAIAFAVCYASRMLPDHVPGLELLPTTIEAVYSLIIVVGIRKMYLRECEDALFEQGGLAND